MTNEEIESICEKYKIKNYTINDGVVDVEGHVDLSVKNLIRLPLKFGKVSGHFDCSTNQITSLEGCPNEVGFYFTCNHNQLTSLDNAHPKWVVIIIVVVIV